VSATPDRGWLGAIDDVLDFSAILGPRYSSQTLTSATKSVNADSIAVFDNLATNQTLVFVNSTSGALSQSSNKLMEVVLSGNLHITASNYIG
jgi:hypothetical protein